MALKAGLGLEPEEADILINIPYIEDQARQKRLGH